MKFIKGEIMIKKKKRVLFPWLKCKQGRLYKSMIAIIIDKEINWTKIFKENKSIKKTFTSLIYPRLKFYFPGMYVKVAKYYSKNGRFITEKDFINLAYLRMTSIFHINKRAKKIIATSEHPANSKDIKLKSSYAFSLRLYKNNNSYGGK